MTRFGGSAGPAQLLVIAKAPVPGRVKTRLCPPCSPWQAAALAQAALTDTIAAVAATPAPARTLVLDGGYPVPPGWAVVPQRGAGLGERLAHAFVDTARHGVSTLLVGMDTPQLTAGLLHDAGVILAAGHADAVLGPAVDGGWWALGLRDPGHASILSTIETSTPDTGAATLAALRERGQRVAMLPLLRDVDTASDAYAVLAACAPGSRFASAAPRLIPAVVRS